MKHRKLQQGDKVEVAAEIRNTGKYAGEEVVQCYLSSPAWQKQGLKQKLVGYQRVSLKPGQAKTVKFCIQEELLKRWNQTNYDLVAISTEQLTHKQVQKARQGRQLTLKMMQKVCRALNVAIWEKLTPVQKEQYFEYMHKHVFNYAKGYDPLWKDPNLNMMA